MKIGHKIEYTSKALYPLRHMGRYIEEVVESPQTLTLEREAELKDRMPLVKELACQMYREAHTLIVKLDGEQCSDAESMWSHDLKMVQWRRTKKFWDYSDENIHPLRHFEEYVEQIEKGNLDPARVEELKNRLSIILSLTVHSYDDADRIMEILYKQ